MWVIHGYILMLACDLLPPSSKLATISYIIRKCFMQMHCEISMQQIPASTSAKSDQGLYLCSLCLDFVESELVSSNCLDQTVWLISIDAVDMWSNEYFLLS